MSVSRPVIVTAEIGSELYNVVKSSNCGLAVSHENMEELSNAINYLSSADQLRESMERNGREFAIANFDQEIIMKRFNTKLINLVRKNRRH